MLIKAMQYSILQSPCLPPCLPAYLHVACNVRADILWLFSESSFPDITPCPVAITSYLLQLYAVQLHPLSLMSELRGLPIPAGQDVLIHFTSLLILQVRPEYSILWLWKLRRHCCPRRAWIPTGIWTHRILVLNGHT